MEINFGDWEMKPFEQNEDPRLQEWYADYMNVAAPVESPLPCNTDVSASFWMS